MSDVVAREVQIKVKLDISDAQQKARTLRTVAPAQAAQQAGRPGAAATLAPTATVLAAQQTPVTAPTRVPGPVARRPVQAIAAAEIGARAVAPIAPATAAAGAGAGAQFARSAVAGAAMASATSAGTGASVLRFGAKAAVLYGAARVGLRGALAYTALLEGAAGGSDVTERLVQLVSGLEEKVTAIESRVVALYESASRTKEIASAAAQVTGQVPNVAKIYSQQFEFTAKERELEKAFTRFKTIQTAKAIGATIGEAVRKGMNR